MVGPDQSGSWLVLIALGVFIGLGIVTGHTLVSYECEAQQMRQTGSRPITAWDLMWIDLTTRAE